MKLNHALKTFSFVLAGIALPFGIATAADAASTQVGNEWTVKLTQVKGRVMVNTGAAYNQANPGALLKTGTKLITPRGASVTLVYKDGCIKEVKENKMVTIGNDRECVAGLINEKSYETVAVGDSAQGSALPAGASAGAGTPIMIWSAGVIGMTLLHNNSSAISKE